MTSRVQQLAVIAITSALLSACSSSPQPKTSTAKNFVVVPPTEDQIEASVKDQLAIMLEAFTPIAGQALPNNTVFEAYKDREFNPIWIENNQLNMSIYKLIDILEKANTHGLNPIHYHADTLKEYLNINTPSQQQLAEIDVIATIALSSYAHDLSNGRYEPLLIDPNWQLDAPSEDWKNILWLSSATDMVNSLPLLAPRHPHYQILQKWLVYYQELADKEPDIKVNVGVPLTLGDEGPRVAQLRARLIQLGDIRFSTRKVNEDQFDERLKDALINFQRRHHLTADGAAGSKTIQTLNIPLKERVKQINYNLERWRWLPSRLEADRIWVDLTDYKVHTHLNGETQSMRVVIGKPARKTPVFYGKMTYMVTNPTWRVPHRIARENLLPKIKENPDYLAKHGYKVFANWSASAKQLDPTTINWKAIDQSKLSYRFEQNADDGNALGLYKFMFPNKNDIYLHDTPAKHLFKEVDRAYSSGCVRLEHPDEFAELLLEGSDSEDKMNEAMNSGETKVITLPQYLPVYLVYFTVVPNDNGMPEFRNDVYKRDKLMEEAMGYAPFSPSDSI
ncbi:L,D-transpeptidase family protein [Marinomonas mediterranea]|jgi:Uncharacterized protein conserved in bacteria|uniref:ErfK/YbiS/YcfS/YnhG family protein n=1 Tax=Marinomonas mediterranea (strain ATCC 700492 / JCM 21426 / NBRC 103028 / MMB-1) TaxID=717774 RepID=F2K0N0_MARM1|nr:L,D-transpeptidase family protein [Marinomonas mediterranea]ADZ91014.1 ErfK/YbiS/YcfS/YnhG family protein [Marinomonas mediterranea MMB-1]WCN09051.1 L,D-transpeptidase family protein [Marinomonas mediterranea]WCN17153.1 L,D-transpeptidase family protein [Marinomonas mediterranea MMB-1]